jgi:hypothetical protein
MNKQELKEAKKIKTSITWDADLHNDVIRLAALDNRNLSNYLETQMTILRNQAIADGRLKKQ